jgi:hypothetical protein
LPQRELVDRTEPATTGGASRGTAPRGQSVAVPAEAIVVPLNMEHLFERRGTDDLGYMVDLCEALTGTWVQLSVFVARTHDDTRWMAVDHAGACPDCSPTPVAAIQLPGFDMPHDGTTGSKLLLRGRLSYGFLVGADGYASFLRLEQAHLFAGAPT